VGAGGATIRLARDGGVSANLFLDWHTAIAGKSNRRTAGSHRGSVSYRAVAVNRSAAYSSPRRRH